LQSLPREMSGPTRHSGRQGAADGGRRLVYRLRNLSVRLPRTAERHRHPTDPGQTASAANRSRDVMSEPESNLPEIHTQLLSPEELQSKLEAIRAAGSLVSIQVKGGAMKMAAPDTMDLGDIRALLQLGNSVQVRYVLDGVQWSDTFSMTDRGMQLIHFALPAGL